MKLYYTEDYCYLDNIIGISYLIIDYAGKLIIEDNTPINYILAEHSQKIIIYEYTQGKSNVDNLFTYRGSLYINKCTIQFKSGNRQIIKIVNKKKRYISKNLNIKSEDMSLLSEEMGIKEPLKVHKTILKSNIITNIDSKNRFYKKDGSQYTGLVHHYLSGDKKFQYYTGGEYTKDSELLLSRKPNRIIKPKPVSPVHRRYLQLLERNKRKRNAKY